MTREELVSNIFRKQSMLCIGLDTDPALIPPHLLSEGDPVFEFNKAIIDATADLAVAYKPNLAFYEAQGLKGWESLQKTIDYLPEDVFVIADAKRGDIGNTSAMYARAFFEQMNCDAVTVAPYMGRDSVEPFLKFPGKWAIVLGLTSNEGAMDFQFLQEGQHRFFEKVMRRCREWGSPDNLMFVVGATRGELLKSAREAAPENFFLIPGIGAQGGSMADVLKFALTPEAGVLINASRSVLYTDNTPEFASAARKQAGLLRESMKIALSGLK